MRFASVLIDGAPVVVEVIDDDVVPLEGITALGPSTRLSALRSADRATADRRPFDSVTLLPSSTQPRRVLCVGLNYRDHIAETRRDTPEYPVLFAKYASSLLGARDDIVLPPESSEVDYEGELAIVIGEPGRRIARSDALDHILGYTVANDITMRDFQYKTHQWIQGKAWDASTPLGPVVVTPDEFDPSSGARIETRIGDDVVQSSTTDQLVFDVADLVAEISTFTMLEPGDVILTGTPGGVGYRRKPQRLLQAGDLVTVSIENLGETVNSVVA